MNGEKKINRNKIRAMAAIGIIILVMVIGTSFALWQITLKQADKNTIATSCLKVNITEDTEAISLQEAFPLSDSAGRGLTPFTFTIENVCDASTFYVVNLETLTSEGKVLPNNYVKTSMFKDTQEVFYDTLKNDYENENKVLSEATKAYMMYQGRLYNKSKVSFDLRLWLDSETPFISETTEATFLAKVTVTNEYIEPVKEKNLMQALQLGSNNGAWGSYYNVSYTQNKKYDVTTVSFESTLNPYLDAVEVIDFSEAQNKDVLGYYVKNEGADTYTLHIQADGRIKANEVASCYGMADSVVGLENFDTSLTKDMSYMFMYNENESLDLSSFNTSKVEYMTGMFYGYSGTSIDFTNFDTSNVKDTSWMFYYGNRLTELNINHFDTSNLVDANHMFVNCRTLTTLDLSNWHTPKLENMSWMFGWNTL